MSEQEIAVRFENQEQRIKAVEKSVQDNMDLVISIKEMAITLKNLTEKHDVLAEKFDMREKEEANIWKKVKMHALTTFVGLCIGALFSLVIK